MSPEITPAQLAEMRAETEGWINEPEARRLQRIFRYAEALAHEIDAYRCDHPSECVCKTCCYIDEQEQNHNSPPHITDYLAGMLAMIRSSSAAYEDMPLFPWRLEGDFVLQLVPSLQSLIEAKDIGDDGKLIFAPK